jgi:hypothetical protein
MQTPDHVLQMQVEGYRRMTPDQKLAALQGMLRFGWSLVEAGVAHRQPDLTPELRIAAVREVFRRGPA